MPAKVTLVVTDAPPLITLAAAASLDYLLYPELPVIIPDAVFHEATAAAGKLGAQEIVDWYREHQGQVRVEPTAIFAREAYFLGISGGKLPRDLGERSAMEVIRDPRLLSTHDRALLLSDDRDVQRLVILDPDRTILLSTWDYLRQLEAAQRIQSADAVMDAARRAGRNVPAHDLWSRHDPDIQSAVRAILRSADDPLTRV